MVIADTTPPWTRVSAVDSVIADASTSAGAMCVTRVLNAMEGDVLAQPEMLGVALR